LNLNKLSFTQILESRLLVEPDIAWMAAQIRDEKDVKGMEDNIEQARKALNMSMSDVRKLNVSFHLEIVKILKNPVLYYITKAIVDLYTEILIDMTRSKMRKTQVLDRIDEHDLICSAIKHGKADLAKELLIKDIVDIHQHYIDMIPKLQDKDSNNLIAHWIEKRGL
jgi:DNA-binding FadR family transcriptional regulator